MLDAWHILCCCHTTPLLIYIRYYVYDAFTLKVIITGGGCRQQSSSAVVTLRFICHGLPPLLVITLGEATAYAACYQLRHVVELTSIIINTLLSVETLLRIAHIRARKATPPLPATYVYIYGGTPATPTEDGVIGFIYVGLLYILPRHATIRYIYYYTWSYYHLLPPTTLSLYWSSYRDINITPSLNTNEVVFTLHTTRSRR